MASAARSEDQRKRLQVGGRASGYDKLLESTAGAECSMFRAVTKCLTAGEATSCATSCYKRRAVEDILRVTLFVLINIVFTSDSLRQTYTITEKWGKLINKYITLETSKITVFLHYLTEVIILINLPLESLSKKPHPNPLCSFKDLSKHTYRQTREATLIYTL
ncbi:unnamed protein product [Chrysodeixis includens]|uniref:Uncharacterized protein n=1 Tax=Chrysodeixis includens TaxID=689277 RepID=A0A9N8L001_CHRIL|nr:unnamed protein product [Chrysodeixis includens]